MTTAYQQAGYAPPNGAPVRRLQGISGLIHGFQKAGKSSFGDSGLRPTLLIDSEQAGVWTPSRKVTWDVTRQTVPVWDGGPGNPGSWDTAVASVKSIDTLWQLARVLNSGQHQFNSISVDSVPTIILQVMEAMGGDRKLTQDQWGVLLRQTLRILWDFKGLLTHPTKQVWAVTFIAGTHLKDGKYRPYFSGQAANLVPYVPDYEGWVWADPATGTHSMWIGPSKEYETGNRLWHRIPDSLQLGYPGLVQGWTVETMAQQVIASQQQ